MEEILAQTDGRIDHDTITDMKYLDAAIQEDLRLSGPVMLHARTCTKDCEVRMFFFIIITLL